MVVIKHKQSIYRTRSEWWLEQGINDCSYPQMIKPLQLCGVQWCPEIDSKSDCKEFHCRRWAYGSGVLQVVWHCGFTSFSKFIQVLPDNMGVVRKALREMQPHVVACGPVGAEKPDEVSWATKAWCLNKFSGCEHCLGGWRQGVQHWDQVSAGWETYGRHLKSANSLRTRYDSGGTTDTYLVTIEPKQLDFDSGYGALFILAACQAKLV